MKKHVQYLYLAFTIEIVFLFFLKNSLEFIVSPIIISSAGIFLSIYPYFMLKNNGNSFIIEPTKNNIKYYLNLKPVFIVFIALCIVTIIIANIVIERHPININQSDIIPFIDEVFVNRFLKGEYVYSIYSGFNYGTFTPGYLPFHWGPFVLSKLINLNFQWVSVIAFLIACFFYLIYLIKNIINKTWLLIHLSLPFLLLYIIYYTSGGSAVQSIEVMVMAYYLLLSITLFSDNVIVKSIGLLLPMLSRYSFLFWVPIYFYNLFKTNFKIFIWVSLILLSLVFILFVIPFVIPNPQILLNMNSNYITSTVEEWNGQSWQAPTDRPFQLFQGIGFASWFYTFANGTLVQKIELTKTFMLVISASSMFIILGLYHKVRMVINEKLFSLLALKVMLTLFYAFIIIPYDYLNWVPLMVSIVILSRINYQNLTNKQ